MSAQISTFMSDFLLAASDYERLDEPVHDFLDNGSPARIDEYSHRISEALVNAKKSITAAVASGSDVSLVDELPEDIRGDVRFALKMSVHWMERVKLLESMLRVLVMETDADYIELMVRARQNLARMGIQEDFPDDDVDEDDTDEDGSDEDEGEEDVGEDYPDDEPFEPRIEHDLDGPEPIDGSDDEEEPVPEGEDVPSDDIPEPESEPDFVHVGELHSEPRVVHGLEDDTIVPVPEEVYGETSEPVPETVPEQISDVHEDIPEEEPVERIPPTAQDNPEPTPAPTDDAKPLTKEDVAGIVLDVITDLLRPEPSSEPQRIEIDNEEGEADPTPKKKSPARKTTTGKKTTTRKTALKKSPVKKVREILKKDVSEEDVQEDSQ